MWGAREKADKEYNEFCEYLRRVEPGMTYAAFRRTLLMAFADWTVQEPREEEIAYYWKIATKYGGSFDDFVKDNRMFGAKKKEEEPGPCSRAILRAAAALGMKHITREYPGFRAQAEVIAEIADRLVALEDKTIMVPFRYG